MLKTSLGRLRVIGLAEGASFLVLLLIAMPLKYMAGQPLAVKYTGWAHGALFMLYVLGLISAAADRDWPIKRTLLGFIAAVLPLGTFVFDRSLKREEEEAALAEARTAAPEA